MLAVQVGLQLRGLSAAKADLAAQQAALADYRTRRAPSSATAVVAPAQRQGDEAISLIRRQATASGLKVSYLSVVDRGPAGLGRQRIQLRLKATGEAAGMDALARWMQRHGEAVSLERLDMTTLPEGGGAQVEADISVLAVLPGSAAP